MASRPVHSALLLPPLPGRDSSGVPTVCTGTQDQPSLHTLAAGQALQSGQGKNSNTEMLVDFISKCIQNTLKSLI